MLRKAYLLLWLVLLPPLVQAAPTVQFDSAEYSVNEDAGTVTITVTISETPNNTVTVDYSTSDDTATEGEDYIENSGTLRWDLFDGSDKTITVTIIDDFEIQEGNETFNLTLNNPTGATIGVPDTTEITIIDNDVPPKSGTFKFSSATYEIDEDEELAKFTVSRVDGSNGIVYVKCVSYDNTAEAGKDYTAVSKWLAWSHGETGDKNCTVPITDDEEYEGNEFFSLKLENAQGGAEIGDPSTAVVTIIDDETEPKYGFLRFSSATYEIEENEGSVKITVNRVDGSDGDISVKYASSDSTAIAEEDYISVSGTLRWNDGDDSGKTITVPIIDDTIHEDDETFILELSEPDGGAELNNPNVAQVTIVNDDPKPEPGILKFLKADYSVSEDGKTANIPVIRVNGSDGAVSVECNSSDGTATAGDDYIKVSGKLNWGDGDASNKECIASILDDSVFEDDETFNLTLENPTDDAEIGDPNTVVVTIIDNEQPGTLQFSKAEYSVNENGVSIDVFVNRVDGTSGAVSVDCISSDDTATAGSDYIAVTETLNWSDQDDKDKACTVQIIDEVDYEDNETFNLTLENATSGAVIGEQNTAEVTIINDDPPPEHGTLQFSSATYDVGEGDGTVEITVTRVDGKSGNISVDYATSDDTAIAGSDYTQTNGTLTWNDGDDTDKTFTVGIINDVNFEYDEIFNITLSNATGGATIGDQSTTEVTIIDDEQPGTLQFSEGTYKVNENGVSIDVIVTRVGGEDGAISVDCISSDDTATAGNDYTGVSDTLNWGHQDDLNKTCTVQIIDDEDFEGDETFNMRLANPTGGAEIGDPDTAEVTITENDPEPPRGTLQFSSLSYLVAESGKTVEITVTRVDGSYGNASVEYTTEDDTAEAGLDYTETSGELNWGDGNTEAKTFTINIFNDSYYEGDEGETFNVILKNPEGAVLGEPSTAVVTIVDDDPKPKLQFSSATYNVSESDGTVEITVDRVGDSYDAISVEYISSDVSAQAGLDYVKVEGTLSWSEGDTKAKTFTVDIFDDDEDEGKEIFILTLLNPTDGAELGIPSTAVVTINDLPLPGTLQFSSAAYEIGEGDGSVEITVTRVGGSDGEASVKAVTSNGTAKSGKDYEKTTKTLKWGDGDATDKTFTVAIFDDNKAEGNETFALKLKNAKGAELDNPKKAEVTIIDDEELEPGTLQFSDATYSVNEDGSSIKIAVTRIGGEDGAVSVDCISSDGTATAGNDYIGIINTLSWSDQDDGDKTCTVQILDDEDFEGNETFNLTLENETGGAAIGEQDSAVVTITDDDESVDPGTLQFSYAMYSVGEGDGTVEITVTRVGGSSGKASVKAVASNGTAKKNKDFEKTTKTLKWDDGEAGDKSFAVAIIDDSEVEGDETFKLKLKKNDGAKLGDQKKAEVTIIDDDGGSGNICDDVAEIPTIECEALVALYESTDGTNWFDNADWNVTNTPCDWNGVICKGEHVSRLYLYSNNLNGEMPPELGNLSGLKRLLLHENDLSGAIPYELGNLSQLQYLWLHDNDLCGDIPETLMDTDIPPSVGYLKLDDNHLITDVSNDLEDWLNDRNPGWEDSQTMCPAEPNTVQFVQNSYEVNEADGTVTLKVSRTEGDGAISVDYATAEGSATEDEDYNGKTGTLDWAENDFADKKIKITIHDEGESEEDETFGVELSNPDGAILGTPKRAVVTIIDAGDPGICDEVTEIGKDECLALIKLYDETDGENWADNTGWKKTNTPCQDWEGVACDGEQVTRLYLYNNNLNGEIPPELSDLTGLERLLLFGNALSGVIPLELGDLSQLQYLWLQSNGLCGDIPDTLMETAIPPNVGFLKLDDNHLTTDVSDELEDWLNDRNPGWEDSQTMCPAPSTLQFSKSTYNVNENKGTVILTVTRTGSSEGEVSVVCATSDESATAGDDYRELFETLSWADGDSSDKVCQIDIFDDSDLEGDETFIVSLGYPNGAELGALNTAVVKFIDDE
jgi:ribosomal protein L35AE/L33A